MPERVWRKTELHCWWEYKLMQPLQKTVWRLLKKLKIKLTGFSNPIPGYIPRQKNICIPMFRAELCTTAKTQKQRKCPSTDKWMKKVCFCYNRTLLSHKEKQSNAICSNMDTIRDFHTKQSQRKTNTI